MTATTEPKNRELNLAARWRRTVFSRVVVVASLGFSGVSGCAHRQGDRGGADGRADPWEIELVFLLMDGDVQADIDGRQVFSGPVESEDSTGVSHVEVVRIPRGQKADFSVSFAGKRYKTSLRARGGRYVYVEVVGGGTVRIDQRKRPLLLD